MSAPNSNTDDMESLKLEIRAAIAAGRETGPEMDQHIADSVLERYRRGQQANQQALAARTAQHGASLQRANGGRSDVATALVAVTALIAFVVIVLKQPDLWWLVFCFPGLFGAWGWSRRSHGEQP